jgi:DNA-binding transcriptional LysR family regulator
MQKCMDWRTVDFDWNRTRAFLVTAEEGSFSAAARALGATQPTVGRQVAALEEELGVTLFARGGPRLELTSSGLELLEHARRMADAALGVSRAAAGAAAAVEGEVVVTASEAMCAFALPAAVAALRRDHPGIRLVLVASNEMRDLHKREADVAIRNVRPTRPDLYARRLGDIDVGIFASRAYVDRAGPFDDIQDLHRADVFAFDDPDIMIRGLSSVGLDLARERFPLTTANHLVQWALCRAGAGLCFMMAQAAVGEPDIVRVVPRYAMALQTWIVCHHELRTSRRLRIVFDALADALGHPER